MILKKGKGERDDRICGGKSKEVDKSLARLTAGKTAYSLAGDWIVSYPLNLITGQD